MEGVFYQPCGAPRPWAASRRGSELRDRRLAPGERLEGLISIRLRYMHSPVELVDLADVQALERKRM
jgi:putative aminopeptidase FrvX